MFLTYGTCFYLLFDVFIDARPVLPCTGTLMCPSVPDGSVPRPSSSLLGEQWLLLLIMLLEHPWYHLAIQQWSCLQGHLAEGHPWLRVDNLISSHHWCICGWQWCLESLVYHQASILIRSLLQPLLLGDTWLWNHNPEVRVDVLGHLPDSSWISVLVTCDQTLLHMPLSFLANPMSVLQL